ncbi:DUF1579 family protein [Nocardia amikacinitolerans]|uniref:DUF1579 family protein n=1 Tax=Nocardia amikacinitolerans TaxID=756689 RepID=UPI0020A4E712|nr:DUF1579 family protein [Nocardia amikacinitolerans]MCP2287999.1 Protein of unknown function (DUF1579) [Nocardia amikacinitolerans]
MRSPLFRALSSLALVAVAALGASCSDDTTSTAASSSMTSAATVDPSTQDPGHRRLNQLVGEWRGDKSTFVAGGTPDEPLRTEIVSRWQWIAETGNNFLREIATGDFGDRPYYRQGTLGYSPTDNRYEWSTVDSVTPMMMTYKGAKDSGGSDTELTVLGEFTDPGVLGERFVGKTIPMRTTIRLESPDRVVMELYFTPPGEAEMIADRVVLTKK